ncbi:protein At-4/1 isoform X2 [Malania oleifera]|uniref:protein At-4/1 isoform X2 n=1 Tax=Malania oleifera TaxID=397392 RepID=UPI0025ADB5B4|nr:protein At-4/1 isoform X2 [Malania oleifera]
MAATDDEEMDSLLSSFHCIHDDFKNAIKEIQSLKSTCNAEIKKREALQFTYNERLTKLYTESLNQLADRLECRTHCQKLKEELDRLNNECLGKENEHRKAMELLKQDHATKIGDLEAQIRGSLLQKATNEVTINHLHQDLVLHKNHIEAMASKLERVNFDLESKYCREIQDLKDCLLVEQEEKNELSKKLQNLEKECGSIIAFCVLCYSDTSLSLSLSLSLYIYLEKFLGLRIDIRLIAIPEVEMSKHQGCVWEHRF